MREGIESQGSEDQVRSYKCPNCTPNQWNMLNTVERIGPSSLSEKFSNGTFTMNVNDRHFYDPDLDDEADNHLLKVSTDIGEVVVEPCHNPSKRGYGSWRYAPLKCGKVALVQPTFWTYEKFVAEVGKELLDIHHLHNRLHNMTNSSRVKS
ncbi:DNA-directed RNA polymerase IV and V subunit 2-like [Forsythia ovata]|uniref:DNA-directed RNA polymerase IV and V subunit 2-like n=1 Tax=Forsythia ovata TaxID=205694 RepID=A0ABD1U4E7_9LAMI